MSGESRLEAIKSKINRLFDAIDRDHNGFVDKNELIVLYNKMDAPIAFIKTMADDELNDCDVDGDRKLSQREYEDHILKDMYGFTGDKSKVQELQQYFDNMTESDFIAKGRLLDEYLAAAAKGN